MDRLMSTLSLSSTRQVRLLEESKVVSGVEIMVSLDYENSWWRKCCRYTSRTLRLTSARKMSSSIGVFSREVGLFPISDTYKQ